MSRPVLEKKAEDVAANLKQVGHSFDPTIIITIVVAVISLFGDCGLSASSAKRRVNKPRWLDRVALRAVLRKHNIRGEEMEMLEAALYDAGEATTAAEMAALFNEVSPPEAP